MGFDTYLEIDGKTALQWRKYASSLPCLLFRHDQVKVERAVDENDEVFVSVRYESTAGEVLETLSRSGLGWNATLAAYSEIRQGGLAAGLLAGSALARGDSRSVIERRAAEFENLGAEVDLTALGATIGANWNDPDAEEVVILKDLTYDGQVSSYYSTELMEIFQIAEKLDGVDEFCVARAVETWVVMQVEAPLIGWPMLICTFLAALPPSTPIAYDLTEDAMHGHMDSITTVDEGRAYASAYWSDSSESLVGSARQLGRLFGVLASFAGGALGEAFWLATAADRLSRLKALNMTPEASTTKARGDALEELMEAMLRAEEPELSVVEKNYRTSEEEIDLVVSNSLTDPFWMAQGSPIILIECKNWKEKIGVPELRVLESKIKDRGAICKVGVFVSISGFASTSLERLKDFQSSDGMIYAIDGADLEYIISAKVKLSEWLRREGVKRALGTKC
ncbi:restriction endonuclease [Kribbella sp. NBC_00382]|uniref:restriction endonuclease n=1 Tax=Kribbella sp. NBC_00382 TaxID=2975967 RepID=UPI002E215B2B